MNHSMMSNDPYQYYSVAEVHYVPVVDHSIDKLRRRSSRFLSCYLFSLALAFFCVSIAGFAPLWTVASLRGSGSVFLVDFNVDFNIGSGIWVKDVCFGGSVPSSVDVLAKFGISCDGTSALDGCEFDENGREVNGNDECTRLRAAEALSTIAIFCTIAALFIGCCSTADSRMRLGFACLFTLLAVFSSIAVLGIMKETNMMDKEFGCVNIVGAEVCYDKGPSLILQTLGVLSLFAGLVNFMICGILSSKARRLEEAARMTPAVTGIRYAVPAGVVVV